MKPILVPVDYSQTALNAAVYALELAHEINSSLILFHAYHPPLPSTGAEFGFIPDINLEKENESLLEDFKNDLLKKVPASVQIECFVKIGFAVDEIVDMVKERDIEFIIMGISGGGKVSEFVLGSNTMAVLQRTNLPLLIVPPHAKFKKPLSMAFACDYKGDVSNKVVASLKEFVKLFHSSLRILNLEKPSEEITFQKAVSSINLETALATVEHSLHFLTYKTDIASELNDFIDSHDIEMLVVVPHRHGLFHRLFNSSITKHFAFHSHIPMLALHE